MFRSFAKSRIVLTRTHAPSKSHHTTEVCGYTWRDRGEGGDRRAFDEVKVGCRDLGRGVIPEQADRRHGVTQPPQRRRRGERRSG